MSITAFKWIPVALLVLGSHAPTAFAQSAPGAAERLHANAAASFRQARFSEAYGRFVALADAGHEPSARMALWMYQNDSMLFGKGWDSNQEQLTAWARLSGQPAPTMVASASPQTLVPVANRTR
jgi:hypothetical protein